MEIHPSSKRSILSVRLSNDELERIDAQAQAQGVKRTDFARALILQARVPKPTKPCGPTESDDIHRALIDGVNRAEKALERTADVLEDHASSGALDDEAIDRAVWQLSAVDVALREALGNDRTH